MTMVTAEFITIIGTVVGTGLALGVGLAMLIMRSTVRVDADRRAFQAEAAQDRRAFQAEAAQDRRALQAEAAQDRRALQAPMDSFRAEMQRLAERQSRVEGMQESHDRAHGTAD